MPSYEDVFGNPPDTSTPAPSGPLSYEQVFGGGSGSSAADQSSVPAAIGTGVISGIPFGRDIAALGNAALSYIPGNPSNPEIQGLPFGQRVSALQNRFNQASAAAGAAHPYVQTGSSLATGAALLPAGAASTLPRAAATGAATGALYGAGEGDSLQDRATRAAYGAGFGGLGGAGGYGLGQVIAPATGAVADAANRLGVPMPRYMMSNPAVQRVGTVSQSIPLVGEFSRHASGQATSALADSVQSLGGGVTPERAGSEISAALNDWIGPTSKNITDRYYQHAASQLDPTVTTPLTATNALVAQLQAKAAARGSTLSGPDLDQIANANTMQGGLTYPAMKDLRTTINQMKPTWGNINPDPAVSARISQLHGALSQDLDSAAANADRTGQGVLANQNAGRIYKGIQDNNEALTPLVGSQGNDPAEKVFSRLYNKASQTPSRGDLQLLQQAKTAVQNSSTPQAWDTFQQGIINGLGIGKSGFTPDLYLNHYSNMPDAAKDIIFSPQNRAVLDDAATVAQKMKEAGFAKNPSGTSHALGLAGLVGAGVEYAPEMMAHPFLTAAGLAGGYGAGRALTGPVTGPGVGGVRNYLAQQLARRAPPVVAGQLGAAYGATP